MSNATFTYTLVRTYHQDDPEKPPPPPGCAIELDDFQVCFDPEFGVIRIDLSGQNVERLKTWGW